MLLDCYSPTPKSLPLRHAEDRSFTPGQVSPVIFPQSDVLPGHFPAWLRPTLNCQYYLHSDLHFCSPSLYINRIVTKLYHFCSPVPTEATD